MDEKRNAEITARFIHDVLDLDGRSRAAGARVKPSNELQNLGRRLWFRARSRSFIFAVKMNFLTHLNSR